MAQRGALADVKRFALAVEAVGVRGTPGTAINPSGYSGLEGEANEEVLVDGRQLGSRKSSNESHIGMKNAKMSYTQMLHENTATQLGAVVKCALGKQYSQTAPVLNAVGNTSAVTKITSGVPDPIVKITYTTGRPDYVPVKTFTATDVNHAILSRIGARTVNGIINAKETTSPAGACFAQDPTFDSAGSTLYAELDQGAEPNDLSWQLQGLVPTKLELGFNLQERVGFDVELTGVDWVGPAASSANIIEQAEFDKEFLGYVWDCNIQSLTTPAAATQQPLVALAAVDLAPTWVPNLYAQGRAASATLPGSNINGWKQGKHFTKDIEITLDIQDVAWDTARQAGTKFQIFLTGYAGQPGDADTNVICIWFPECILNANPESTEVNGIMGYKLKFLARESLDLTAAHQTHCVVAFFNS